MVRGRLVRLWLEEDFAESFHLSLVIHLLLCQLRLEVIELTGLSHLIDSRSLVIRLEGFENVFALIHEIENESVFLQWREDSVQARERLHRLDIAQALIHVHGM